MARLAWIGAALLAATGAAAPAAEERSYPNEIVYLPGHTVMEKVGLHQCHPALQGHRLLLLLLLLLLKEDNRLLVRPCSWVVLL